MTDEVSNYDLPCILLKAKGQKYRLFADGEYFGSDYKPETIDIPLQEGDQYNSVLFDSPIFYFILEIKYFLGIEKDIILEFPQLDLVLHQDLPYLRKLSPYQFHNFYVQLLLSKGVSEEDLLPMEIVLTEHNNCIRDQLSFLSHISVEGGLPSNPIVLDDSDEFPEEDPSDSSDELTDQRTDLVDPNQELPNGVAFVGSDLAAIEEDENENEMQVYPSNDEEGADEPVNEPEIAAVGEEAVDEAVEEYDNVPDQMALEVDDIPADGEEAIIQTVVEDNAEPLEEAETPKVQEIPAEKFESTECVAIEGVVEEFEGDDSVHDTLHDDIDVPESAIQEVDQSEMTTELTTEPIENLPESEYNEEMGCEEDEGEANGGLADQELIGEDLYEQEEIVEVPTDGSITETDAKDMSNDVNIENIQPIVNSTNLEFSEKDTLDAQDDYMDMPDELEDQSLVELDVVNQEDPLKLATIREVEKHELITGPDSPNKRIKV